jgi:hypothetical protein
MHQSTFRPLLLRFLWQMTAPHAAGLNGLYFFIVCGLVSGLPVRIADCIGITGAAWWLYRIYSNGRAERITDIGSSMRLEMMIILNT